MTTNKHVQFLVRLSNAETEATTLCIADTNHVISQRKREIYGITLKDQMQLKMEFSIRLVEFKLYWQAIGVVELQNSIEQLVKHFLYRMMHLMSQISESIWRIDSGNNFITNSSEWLHISNVKEAY